MQDGLRRAVTAIAVAMLLGTPSLVFAQGTRVAVTRAPVPAAPPRVTSVEGITEYRLANGLRVLLFPDPGKPTVTVNVTYVVGSRHEGYGETGMAHLLEHMVFKPTTRRTNIPQEMNAHGARFNGSTWYDRTNYYETVPSSDENLAWAIDLEADRMVNARVDKKDLETEFSVVRNEYESGENSPFRVLLERTLSTAYIWHNYGKSTIGARSDIEQMPIERLKAFYQKYYQPDDAVLTIAGKFDVDKTLALVTRAFGAIPKPVRSLDRGNMLYPTYTREPAQDGERSVTLRRTGDVQIAMVAYHVPAGPHADYAAVSVLADVLGEAPAGRLYKRLVETKQAADVGTITLALAEPGPLLAFANVRKEDPLDTAVASIDRTIDELLTTNPATEAEVNRVKTTQLKNIDLTLNSSERVGLGLSEYIAAGDWRLLFLNRDRLQQVSVADVNRVARLYLKPSNKTVGLFIPTDKPDRADVADAGDVGAMVKDYRGNAALVAGEAFDPTPENIDRRAVRSSLPNGLKLALLPKRTRGDLREHDRADAIARNEDEIPAGPARCIRPAQGALDGECRRQLHHGATGNDQAEPDPGIATTRRGAAHAGVRPQGARRVEADVAGRHRGAAVGTAGPGPDDVAPPDRATAQRRTQLRADNRGAGRGNQRHHGRSCEGVPFGVLRHLARDDVGDRRL